MLTLVAPIPITAHADDNRARVNYMLHCQGCHLPDASGMPGRVPRMKEFLGFFLHSEEGRAFVIQVPGVATAQLPDDQVAELMNWILANFSADQLPDGYQPYTAKEVSDLRKNPEADPEARRGILLREIAKTTPLVSQSGAGR